LCPLSFLLYPISPQFSGVTPNKHLAGRFSLAKFTAKDGKNAAAVALGRMGGKARAEGMSAKRRKEIAKKAAASWRDR
jgi:hypothetical protein